MLFGRLVLSLYGKRLLELIHHLSWRVTAHCNQNDEECLRYSTMFTCIGIFSVWFLALCSAFPELWINDSVKSAVFMDIFSSLFGSEWIVQ